MEQSAEIYYEDLSPWQREVLPHVVDVFVYRLKSLLRNRDLSDEDLLRVLQSDLGAIFPAYLPEKVMEVVEFIREYLATEFAPLAQADLQPQELARIQMRIMVTLGEVYMDPERPRRLPEVRFEPLSALPDPKEIAHLDWKLPKPGMAYKGGIARLLLKYRAKSNGYPLIETWDAELPPSDVDIMVFRLPNETEEMLNQRAAKLAEEFGVDPEGIEIVDDILSPETIQKKLARADVTFNQVLVTSEGLWFTEDANESVQTGTIEGVPAGNSIYGRDSATEFGHTHLSRKSLGRLVTKVAEGKAKAFRLPAYNLETDVGIYWLVALRKFIFKEDRALLVYRLWQCAKLMGQTQAEKPQDFIDEVRGAFKKFRFGSNGGGGGGARWIAEKVVNVVGRHLKPGTPKDPPPRELDATMIRIEPDDSELESSPGLLAEIDEYLAQLLESEK